VTAAHLGVAVNAGPLKRQARTKRAVETRSHMVAEDSFDVPSLRSL